MADHLPGGMPDYRGPAPVGTRGARPWPPLGTAGEPLSRPRDGTLEPPACSGMRFLGIAGSWPGIAMMVVGAALLSSSPAV